MSVLGIEEKERIEILNIIIIILLLKEISFDEPNYYNSKNDNNLIIINKDNNKNIYFQHISNLLGERFQIYFSVLIFLIWFIFKGSMK